MTGEQIKELRKSLGYTQARLAEEVGLTPNTIARYERDELKPSPPWCFYRRRLSGWRWRS